MLSKLLALPLLLAAAAAGQTTIDLAGGLKAQVIALSRAGEILNVAVKISNESKDRTSAFILLYAKPSAFNDGGGTYKIRSVNGVAYCERPDRACISPDLFLFPLQQYTEIEPGKSITVHFLFGGGNDKGETITLTQQIAYCFADFDTQSKLTDDQKLNTLHYGGLSFNEVKPLTADINSSVKFDAVK
jgi:hypothetical protein